MTHKPMNRRPGFRANLRLARVLWPGQIDSRRAKTLRMLSEWYGMSLPGGDLQLLDGHWYVTHSGLIRLSERKGCWGIRVEPVKEFCESVSARWIFRAVVYKTSRGKGFVGYGDADPSNVSPLVRGAEMRVAETRAVNRALRKAYGIGLCSVEELGWLSGAPRPFPTSSQTNGSQASNGSQNGQPRLRDQLCLLIRQYSLDPTLVKAYAADFCGTQSLKDASRDRAESFISQLAAEAKADPNALICKLNSYAPPAEVKP